MKYYWWQTNQSNINNRDTIHNISETEGELKNSIDKAKYMTDAKWNGSKGFHQYQIK